MAITRSKPKKNPGNRTAPYVCPGMQGIPQILPHVHAVLKEGLEPTPQEEAENELAIAAACEAIRKRNGWSPFPQR